MKSLMANLSSERLPEPHVTVMVAGGIALWTGKQWLSLMEDRHRPITWEVKWWLPLLQDEDVL